MNIPKYSFDTRVARFAVLAIGVVASSVQADCLPTNATHWWPADGHASDIVQALDGVLENGANYGTGRVAGAFVLDGDDDHVGQIGTTESFSFIQNTGVFSIEGWIQIDDPFSGDFQSIVANCAGTAQKGFFFVLTGSRELRFFAGRGVGGSPTVDSTSSPDLITDSDWHHVAVVADGSNVVFYVDGVSNAGNDPIGTKSVGDSSQLLSIGSCPGGVSSLCPFGGSIDELAVHAQALTMQDILDLYAAGSDGRCKSHDDPSQTVWGVKSLGPVDDASSAPSYLFSYSGGGSGSLLVRGILTLNSQPVDVDGLCAFDSTGVLGFVLDQNGSQLSLVDPETASLTPVGSLLVDREIRGAAFISGYLWALDALNDQLIRVDTASGEVLGAPVTLTVDGIPHDLPDFCDIAFDGIDTSYVIAGAQLYTINLASGDLSPVFLDTNPDDDDDEYGCAPNGPVPPFAVGAAFAEGAGEGHLYTLDVACEDDLYLYDLGNGFLRTQAWSDLLGVANSGRGDLATFLPISPTAGTHEAPASGSTHPISILPNPFEDSTSIRYHLSQEERVSVSVIAASGAVVAQLVSRTQPAGQYSVIWDGRNDQGIRLGAGVYYVRVATDNLVSTGRAIVLK